ncbi:hypothetical protein R2A130_2846 [Ahrensia sp. R2A130]|nr:hypothetical protein R2A130_2846 [Ahrensia sp. R2A130]
MALVPIAVESFCVGLFDQQNTWPNSRDQQSVLSKTIPNALISEREDRTTST